MGSGGGLRISWRLMLLVGLVNLAAYYVGVRRGQSRLPDYELFSQRPPGTSLPAKSTSQAPHDADPAADQTCPVYTPGRPITFRLPAPASTALSAFKRVTCMHRRDCPFLGAKLDPETLMARYPATYATEAAMLAHVDRFPRIMQTFHIGSVESHYMEHLARFFKSWRMSHPSWSHVQWTPETGRLLVAQYLPEFVAIYDRLELVWQAQFVKVLAMFQFGGVWHDQGVEALASFDDLEDILRRCILHDRPKKAVHRQLFVYADATVSGHAAARFMLMAATPHNLFFGRVLEALRAAYQRPWTEPILDDDGQLKVADPVPANTPTTPARQALSSDSLNRLLRDRSTRVNYLYSPWPGPIPATPFDEVQVQLSTEMWYPSIDLSARNPEDGGYVYSETDIHLCDFDHLSFDPERCKQRVLQLFDGSDEAARYEQFDWLPVPFADDMDIFDHVDIELDLEDKMRAAAAAAEGAGGGAGGGGESSADALAGADVGSGKGKLPGEVEDEFDPIAAEDERARNRGAVAGVAGERGGLPGEILASDSGVGAAGAAAARGAHAAAAKKAHNHHARHLQPRAASLEAASAEAAAGPLGRREEGTVAESDRSLSSTSDHSESSGDNRDNGWRSNAQNAAALKAGGRKATFPHMAVAWQIVLQNLDQRRSSK